jgi:hypothetical protein
VHNPSIAALERVLNLAQRGDEPLALARRCAPAHRMHDLLDLGEPRTVRFEPIDGQRENARHDGDLILDEPSREAGANRV